MSEYWKSTPKIWCKHCKIFVRDTKLEKQNHDATPKHQGNLKRFLRDLHRNEENTERDKERARREVERVTGIVNGGGSSSASGSGSWVARAPATVSTPAQRKQQLSQLAEMGINIPDEFRGDLAMAGDWQVLSERIILAEGEAVDPSTIGIGVRKREEKDEDGDEEENVAKKAKWATTRVVKSYPDGGDEEGLDELLRMATKSVGRSAVKTEDEATAEGGAPVPADVKEEVREEDAGAVTIKRESAESKVMVLDLDEGSVKVEQEPDASTASTQGIVFKKRKTKNVRQK